MIEQSPTYILEAFARGVNRFNFDPLYSDLEGWVKVKRHLEAELEQYKSERESRRLTAASIKTGKNKVLANAMASLANRRISDYERAEKNINLFLAEISDEHVVTWELL